MDRDRDTNRAWTEKGTVKETQRISLMFSRRHICSIHIGSAKAHSQHFYYLLRATGTYQDAQV